METKQLFFQMTVVAGVGCSRQSNECKFNLFTYFTLVCVRVLSSMFIVLWLILLGFDNVLINVWKEKHANSLAGTLLNELGGFYAKNVHGIEKGLSFCCSLLKMQYEPMSDRFICGTSFEPFLIKSRQMEFYRHRYQYVQLLVPFSP